MTIDKKFLEDEVRLGFYIPATIKQAWAAELEILSVIDDICTQNSLKYFADWGTFLGAVRHGGFIPWDDDLDLVMLREDYNKFLSIADSSLPKGYSVHTYRNEENFVEFHAVVINTEHSRFDKEHFDKFHGFPYICGVDIFVLDYIYLDEAVEKKRCSDTTFIIAFADGMLAGEFNSATINVNLDKIENICHTKINRNQTPKDLWINLYELAENKCSEVSPLHSNTLTQIVPWGLKGDFNRRYPESAYNQICYLPFEVTSIPVPLYYDKLLSQRYGDYMKIVKNAGAHEYPFFEEQKTSLESLLGTPINTYTFPTNTILRTSTLSEHWKLTVKECLLNLSTLHNNLLELDDSILDTICDSQQLSIELGEFIEELKGSNHISISFIEQYCEALYALYAFVSGEDTNEYTNRNSALQNFINSIMSSFANMIDSITKNVLSKKEIVFLPFSSKYWTRFDDLYKSYNKEDYDVYVVPIPYYYKNYDGTLSDEMYDISSYPDSLDCIPFCDFSLELHHPDVIYIQSPYDQYNASTSIHPDFYSSQIYNYTNKLVYVPWFTTEDFTEADIRSYKNMTHYVCVPGIVYSDEIIVQSHIIKNTYVQKLVEWAGKKTLALWNNKLTVADSQIPKTITNKKTILYYLGTGQPLQNDKYFIDKLKTNLQTLSSFSELTVYVVISKELKNTLLEYNEKLYINFSELISNSGKYKNLVFLDTVTDDLLSTCAAYYGDASPYASIFRYYGKPVMIQNYALID